MPRARFVGGDAPSHSRTPRAPQACRHLSAAALYARHASAPEAAGGGGFVPPLVIVSEAEVLRAVVNMLQVRAGEGARATAVCGLCVTSARVGALGGARARAQGVRSSLFVVGGSRPDAAAGVEDAPPPPPWHFRPSDAAARMTLRHLSPRAFNSQLAHVVARANAVADVRAFVADLITDARARAVARAPPDGARDARPSPIARARHAKTADRGGARALSRAHLQHVHDGAQDLRLGDDDERRHKTAAADRLGRARVPRVERGRAQVPTRLRLSLIHI